MATNFSKEMKESCGSILNQLEKMIRQLEERDQEKELGLDSRGRLIISIFYGDNTEWWISRAEKIFSRNQLLEAQKVEAATSCFDWETWKWFREVDQLRPVRTWDELKRLMLARFHMNELCSGEKLLTGKHRSMVYREISTAEQRGQLGEFMLLSPTPEKRSEQDLEEISGKSLVQEKSNEGKLLDLDCEKKLTQQGDHRVSFNQAQERMGLNTIKLNGPITNYKIRTYRVIPISSPINYNLLQSETKRKERYETGEEDIIGWVGGDKSTMSFNIDNSAEGGDMLGFLINSKVELSVQNTIKGRITQQEDVQILIGGGLAHHCISLFQIQVLENPQCGATGYGILMDKILLVVNGSTNIFGLNYHFRNLIVTGIAKEMVWVYDEVSKPR